MYKEVDKSVARSVLTGFFHHCSYLTGEWVLSLFSKKYAILQNENIMIKWRLLLSVKTSWHSIKLYNYEIPLLLHHIETIYQTSADSFQNNIFDYAPHKPQPITDDCLC